MKTPILALLVILQTTGCRKSEIAARNGATENARIETDGAIWRFSDHSSYTPPKTPTDLSEEEIKEYFGAHKAGWEAVKKRYKVTIQKSAIAFEGDWVVCAKDWTPYERGFEQGQVDGCAQAAELALDVDGLYQTKTTEQAAPGQPATRPESK